ncbi:hypothetical protein M501DRAFT_1010159 [Patellaria atrata CBS 101060]|uniref:LicD/FKTN/FKRP nucleotidyltransferase domain-containing protein n=1 Tax=Patellaria atrata CBS 101060 TaxID=1346257 RepID=A0A9P4SE46_9PEZI|nr:hypothetical protein M501DRAFT_1010159 [Patellaria atrata CBS 101060]
MILRNSLALLIAGVVGLVAADADFASVRVHLEKDHSGKGGDKTGQKYFHESTANRALPPSERLPHLQALVKTYLSTMNDIGIETWIMHGTLLGWWWNRKIMPWDSDLDVQMSLTSMEYMASYYNMTIHHYHFPGEEKPRDYMIEVNPHYTNGSLTDRHNVIDARWIDINTGMFIDIAALRQDVEADPTGELGKMRCKDRHRYERTHLFPLRDSYFENTPVKIPYAYSQLLEKEYGAKSLTQVDFADHHFDSATMEWKFAPK